MTSLFAKWRKEAREHSKYEDSSYTRTLEECADEPEALTPQPASGDEPSLLWERDDDDGSHIVHLKGVPHYAIIADGKTREEALHRLGDILKGAFMDACTEPEAHQPASGDVYEMRAHNMPDGETIPQSSGDITAQELVAAALGSVEGSRMTARTARTAAKCINCGEANDGGYEFGTEQCGYVAGPFCSVCFHAIIDTVNRWASSSRHEPIRHGYNCEKKPHVRTGYLHGEDDDTPYDVDGCTYCGRCHVGLS